MIDIECWPNFRHFFSWYHLADLCIFYCLRSLRDWKTSPKNKISLGPAVSKVQIVLKRELHSQEKRRVFSPEKQSGTLVIFFFLLHCIYDHNKQTENIDIKHNQICVFTHNGCLEI